MCPSSNAGIILSVNTVKAISVHGIPENQIDTYIRADIFF